MTDQRVPDETLLPCPFCPQAEPFAWAYMTKYGNKMLSFKREDMTQGYTHERALYTKPMAEHDRLAQWQPIETAPKDGTEILGGFYSTRGEWVRFVMTLAANGTWVSVPGSWAYNPTHWMSLAAAPESEGRKL